MNDKRIKFFEAIDSKLKTHSIKEETDLIEWNTLNGESGIIEGLKEYWIWGERINRISDNQFQLLDGTILNKI